MLLVVSDFALDNITVVTPTNEFVYNLPSPVNSLHITTIGRKKLYQTQFISLRSL